MKIQNLKDAFALKLMALYDVEIAITKALPKMVKGADSVDLKEIFNMHLDQTKKQIERLEVIFSDMEMKPKKAKVEAIRGMMDDTSWLMRQNALPQVMDSMLIGAARYVEHYEMAGYMTLADWALLLKYNNAHNLITETLNEERDAEMKLVQIAERMNQASNIS